MNLFKRNSRPPAWQTGVRVHLRRWLHAREVKAVRIGAGLKGSSLVAVLLLKNEALRLPHIMDYYRGLGVDHFIVIDNESDDTTPDTVLAADDATLFRATGLFRDAHYGIDWVNHVLSRYCHGKWVVHVDADEYLVWPSRKRPSLRRLCRVLEEQGRPSLQGVMVDMYSHQEAWRNAVVPHQDPLEVTSLFDSDGYLRYHDPRMRGTWIKGGVRGRHFFPSDPHQGPALNKTPLVRWRRHYAFVQVAHELWPPTLNGGHARPGLGILHFKFTSYSVAKVVDGDLRSQHTREYDAYDDIENRILVNESTRAYTEPEDLVRAGLVVPVPGLT